MTLTDEVRNIGRSMRLSRQRESQTPGSVIEGTRVWHDYDGDEIYADVSIAYDANRRDFTATPLAANEPGIGSHDGSEAVYSHGDQIGSMRMLTYEGAAVGRQAVYTAFGERVWQDGSIGATRYQYAGAWGYQTFPEHTGQPGDELPFIHVGHRWYDPSTGRFLQRDPIGIRGGLNTYTYVSNRPTGSIDPLGLSSLTEVIDVISDLETLYDIGNGIAKCDIGGLIATGVEYAAGATLAGISAPIACAVTVGGWVIDAGIGANEFVNKLQTDRHNKPGKPFDFDDSRFDRMLDRIGRTPGGIDGGIFDDPAKYRKRG